MIVIVLVAVGSLALPVSALAASTAPPMIESESVSHITERDATLNARIDPNGLATAYKLQIDTTGNFKFDQSDSCVLHPPGIACAQVVIEGEPLPEGLVEPPEGSIPAGYETQHVSVDLASIGATLQPDTTYHYRAIAANDASVVEGPDQTFTTPPGTQEPLIEGKSVSNITPTDATLEVEIYPGGLETSYEVWLGTVGCIEENLAATCESTRFVGTIPVSFSTQTVSVDVAKAWHDLLPTTHYVYSVRASNSAGKAYGDYAFFETRSASTPLIESESVSHITPTDATLGAQINTEGLETTYEFHLLERWGCEESTPACYPPIRLIPLPSGKLLGSFVGQTVSLDLNSAGVSLSPGHNFYEYSVSATNAAGTTEGQPQRFTTPTAAAQAEPQSLTDPSVSMGGLASAATQSPTSGSPSHSRRHRHHHRHRRGLHRSKLKRQRPSWRGGAEPFVVPGGGEQRIAPLTSVTPSVR